MKNVYTGCEGLEERSGNDNSPNSLKGELAEHLGELPSREALCQMVVERRIDVRRMQMPSFQAFQTRLNEVI